MLPLRGTLLLMCACGVVLARAPECDETEAAIEDVLALRERVDYLIHILTHSGAATEPKNGPTTAVPTTAHKVVPTTTKTKSPATTIARTETPTTTPVDTEPPATTSVKAEPPVTTIAKTEPPTTTTVKTEPPATPPATTTVKTEVPTTTVKTEPPTTTSIRTEPPTTTIATTKTTTELPTEPPTTTEEVTTVPLHLKNCKQILDAGYKFSGTYKVSVDGFPRPISVYCDMNTDGGGWMVIQRRLDGSVKFNRTFAEYARGFGDLSGEFWLGNDKISAVTKSAETELRVEMGDWEGNDAYAKYRWFRVEGADKSYRLSLGGYKGTSGDSLGYHDGSRFSTYDVDNDASGNRNCALRHGGGWWFGSCMRSNLNGQYLRQGDYDTFPDGIEWSRFRGLRYSLMFTEMKIRPGV